MPSALSGVGAAKFGSAPSLVDRVRARLLGGSTTASIAKGEMISLALAEIMVDDLLRRGLAASATSLCASGLGACEGGDGEDVRVHCAGCPIKGVFRAPADSK